MRNNVRNKVTVSEDSYVIVLCYCEKESRRRWLRVDAIHSAAPSGTLFVNRRFRVFGKLTPRLSAAHSLRSGLWKFR